jgi:hypothetical protein
MSFNQERSILICNLKQESPYFLAYSKEMHACNNRIDGVMISALPSIIMGSSSGRVKQINK